MVYLYNGILSQWEWTRLLIDITTNWMNLTDITISNRSQTKTVALYASICMKFKNRQNWSMSWEVRIAVTLERGWWSKVGREKNEKRKGKTKNVTFFFFLIFYLFIYLLFLAVLGLRFCARAFSSCGERGPLFIAVRGPLPIAASFVAEHRLQTRRLSSCGSWVQLLRSMWDPPRPGPEPVSPALAGRLPTTAPPGKP